ncbi:MAG: hypothetical protein QW589_05875 [Candidatus Bathyarchaeia archaeon]
MGKNIKKIILNLGSILCIIGSIIMIVISAFELIGFMTHFFLLIRVFSYFKFAGPTRILITLICGLISLYGSKKVENFAWAIVLIILGLIGGGIGGILVFLGALLAAISVAL